jgi:hypothetical protein
VARCTQEVAQECTAGKNHGAAKDNPAFLAQGKTFAFADDYDDSNGKTVLTFFEAQDAAKKLARGEDGSAETAPITVDGALNGYRALSVTAT